MNYPSTEYLDLPFVDLFAFNVYLESKDRLQAYLARLQNLAGDRLVLMAEIGLDTLRNGKAAQAELLSWQISSVFAEGACGLFVFAWTDEWYRGGALIEDWKFGLTCSDRSPKAALAAVQRAFTVQAQPRLVRTPLVSVVVCSYNGARTIQECLEGIQRLTYPKVEVIVVDDGSKDATAELARPFNVRVISIPNGGLSNARNVGWRAAQGEIVAYIDDDARPDPHWLNYMVSTLTNRNLAGAGGPNLSPLEDGFIQTCVDHSPGNPTHVLIDDRVAEHVPGCNMAFWRHCLEAVDGFDPAFRIAGDDVDFCWRIQERGWVIGFNAAALVWHHRRGSVKTYLRQQTNYGRAEAMLERKWPDKYNATGHLCWTGRVYTKAAAGPLFWSSRRVYHGTWGTALFQSVYDVAPFTWASVLALPEWYLVSLFLGLACLASVAYPSLDFAHLGFLTAVTGTVVRACAVVSSISMRVPSPILRHRIAYRGLVTVLHVAQPAARLWGRLSYGLTPWRNRGGSHLAMPIPRVVSRWSETWREPEDRLRAVEKYVRAFGPVVVRGGGLTDGIWR